MSRTCDFGFGNQHSIQLSYGRPPCILRTAYATVHSIAAFQSGAKYARAIMRDSRYRLRAAPEGFRNERRPVYFHQDAQTQLVIVVVLASRYQSL